MLNMDANFPSIDVVSNMRHLFFGEMLAKAAQDHKYESLEYIYSTFTYTFISHAP